MDNTCNVGGTSNVEDQQNMEDRSNEQDKPKEPREGMLFNSVEEVKEFYTRYGNALGFSVFNRQTVKGDDGERRYVTFSCSRAGKFKSKTKNMLQMRPTCKTDCPAKISAAICHNGKWKVSHVMHDHNHDLSPSKSRFHRGNRIIRPYVRRKLEINDRAGIKVNKNFNSCVVEAGGYENVTFLERDCRNYIDKVRRLRLGQGDASAIQNYFMKMQANTSNFFYMIDLDNKGRLRNVFWADARSRLVYEEFGDVITFDTTYLTNKYDIPFAPYVGVNHHGQSTLLGCGLLSSEDTETFIWLFQSWLTCMSGRTPSAIITNQDKAMQKAIHIVFPNTRHRWCLWHIMKKLPEKFRCNKQYESIKLTLQNIVYDSLTHDEFEERWNNMLEKYNLQNNDWLLGLYEERQRWVPTYLKYTFWAGMSTTQRSESMNAFFDGYVHSKTSLKQFVEQYEIALRSKIENENKAYFDSFHSFVPCVTLFAMEKQFQEAYTTTKFKEFQLELTWKIYCGVLSVRHDDAYSEYEVSEISPNGETHRLATFKVSLTYDDGNMYCNCCLFESKGIICRHAIVVLIHNKILKVPEKYIISRWRKDVKRRHTKVKINYHDWSDKPEARRFDDMCNAFYEVADMTSDSEHKTNKVIGWIKEMKNELKRDECICESSNQGTTTIGGHVISKSNESGNVLTPIAVRSKGRPPFKRKQSKVEHVITKYKQKEKKKESKSKKTNKSNTIQESLIVYGNIGGAVFGTQESNIAGSSNEPTSPDQVLWGVHQSGPPIQAYGQGYVMNNPIHPMFSHQTISQAHMLPDLNAEYGVGSIVSSSDWEFGINNMTRPSNGNIEGDGRPHKGN